MHSGRGSGQHLSSIDHNRVANQPIGESIYPNFDLWTGLPFWLVDANASSCSLFIDSYIDFAAPLSSPAGFSPFFATSATPAAIFWAFDFAGI